MQSFAYHAPASVAAAIQAGTGVDAKYIAGGSYGTTGNGVTSCIMVSCARWAAAWAACAGACVLA